MGVKSDIQIFLADLKSYCFCDFALCDLALEKCLALPQGEESLLSEGKRLQRKKDAYLQVPARPLYR